MLTWLDTSWDFKEKTPEVAILPLAAFEPHAAHLPVGTDQIIMDAIARAVADRLSQHTFLMPTWPLGTSGHFAGQDGAIYLTFETLWAVVDDLVHSLHQHGIYKVAVLNNHGSALTTTTAPLGNFIVKTAVRQLNYELPGVTTIWVQPFAAARAALAEIFPSAMQEVHAGAVETSILMHLAGDLVDEPGADHVPALQSAYIHFAQFQKLAPHGVWGKPSEASASRGKQALGEVVAATATYIEHTFEQLEQLKGGGDRDNSKSPVTKGGDKASA